MSWLMFNYLLYFILLTFPFFSHGQQLPKGRHDFTVIAHRGNHAHAPENTLKAIRDAINIDADYVEIDLRTTKDGHLVIMHDASLLRMCGLDKKVKDITLKEIKALIVRDLNHPEYGKYQIPSFEEILALCHNNIHIYLDFKDADVKKTYELIRKYKMEKSLVVYINSKSQFEAWRQIAPDIPLMISLPEKVNSAHQMREILKKYPCDILDGNYKEYTAETVKEAQKLGVPVWADIQSVNEAEVEWESAIKTGLKGLQTDYPKELILYLYSKETR
jgi:glycerophosphoryl diester phosphodiesterase